MEYCGPLNLRAFLLKINHVDYVNSSMTHSVGKYLNELSLDVNSIVFFIPALVLALHVQKPQASGVDHPAYFKGQQKVAP